MEVLCNELADAIKEGIRISGRTSSYDEFSMISIFLRTGFGKSLISFTLFFSCVAVLLLRKDCLI